LLLSNPDQFQTVT